MEYLLSFLEGIVTFVSPCLLPMLPIYLSYFAGQDLEHRKALAIRNAGGFVLGFSIQFMLLGAFAGGLGSLLRQHSLWVNLVCGLVMILFGLNYMGAFSIPWINQNRQMGKPPLVNGFLSALLFGIVFSISWTPCVGTFLGAALMLAAHSGDSLRGLLMLLCFSLGLGLPFVLSAVLIGKLKRSVAFLNRHARRINWIAGLFLVVLGVLVAASMLRFFYTFL